MVLLYTAPPAGAPLDHDSLLAKFDALVANGLVFCSPSKIIRLEEKGFICEFRINQALSAKPQLGDALQKVGKGETFGPGSDLAYVHPDIVLASINDTHLLIANLYCVVRPQLLLLTKDSYRRQVEPLDDQDLEAAKAVLVAVQQQPYYAMFNGTATAGASREHKHLHILPYQDHIQTIGKQLLEDKPDGLPFIFYWTRVDITQSGLLEVYNKLLAQTRAVLNVAPGAICPHNVILTQEWLMVIPRRSNDFHGITSNGAGMIGSVWLQNETQYDKWTQFGPVQVLSHLGVAKAPSKSMDVCHS